MTAGFLLVLSFQVEADLPNCSDLYMPDQQPDFSMNNPSTACRGIKIQDPKSERRQDGTYAILQPWSGKPYHSMMSPAQRSEREKELSKVFARLKALYKERVQQSPDDPTKADVLKSFERLQLSFNDNDSNGCLNSAGQPHGESNAAKNSLGWKIVVCSGLLENPPESWVATLAHELGHFVDRCPSFGMTSVGLPNATYDRIKRGDASLFRLCAAPGKADVVLKYAKKTLSDYDMLFVQGRLDQKILTTDAEPLQPLASILSSCGLLNVLPPIDPKRSSFPEAYVCARQKSTDSDRADQNFTARYWSASWRAVSRNMSRAEPPRLPMLGLCATTQGETFADAAGAEITADYISRYHVNAKTAIGAWRADACIDYGLKISSKNLKEQEGHDGGRARLGVFLSQPGIQHALGCSGLRPTTPSSCPGLEKLESSASNSSRGGKIRGSRARGDSSN